jgi:hypothetical protein
MMTRITMAERALATWEGESDGSVRVKTDNNQALL